MIDFSTFPKTRRQARAQGSKYFYTGTVCVGGHDVPWYTSTNQCTACKGVRKFLPAEDTAPQAPGPFVHLLADWTPVVGWS